MYIHEIVQLCLHHSILYPWLLEWWWEFKYENTIVNILCLTCTSTNQFVPFAIFKILQIVEHQFSSFFLCVENAMLSRAKNTSWSNDRLIMNRSFSRLIDNRGVTKVTNSSPPSIWGRGKWWASGRNGLMCKTAFNSIPGKMALIRFMQNKSGHVKQVTWRKCAIRRQLARREGAYCNLSAAIRGICSHM